MAERKVITSKDKDGKDLVLVVNKPNAKQLTDAQIVASNTFKEAVKKGGLLRAKLNEELATQGLWDKEKENKLIDLSRKINDGERRLARGGAGGFTKEEAKKLALDMRKYRNEQAQLLEKSRELDVYTIESQAENARFDYLVSVCVTFEDSRPAFASYEDYKEKATETYAADAAAALGELLYKIDTKLVDNLPENKFLKEYKFVDEKLRLVNKEGKLITEDGKLIDENNRYVNEEGKYVDVNGNLVDEAGNPIEVFVPFAE